MLDQNGSVISLPPSQIGNKIEKKKFAATVDYNGSEIRHGDKVRDIRNEQIQGVVLHIRHTFLFLQNREQMKNSGISVVHSNNVILTSARDGRLDKRTQGRPAEVAPFPRNTLKENTAMGPPLAKASNFSRFIGAAVSIRKGPYKGLRGLIRSVDDSLISVELQAKSKTIRVAYDAIGFVEYVNMISSNKSPLSVNLLLSIVNIPVIPFRPHVDSMRHAAKKSGQSPSQQATRLKTLHIQAVALLLGE